VEWESPPYGGKFQVDESLKRVIFTLNNPRNVPARTFAFRPQKLDGAICCHSKRGPHFDGIVVVDNCNVKIDSFTDCFGTRYTSDIGLERRTFFTGSERFKVKEIEGFETTDCITPTGLRSAAPPALPVFDNETTLMNRRFDRCRGFQFFSSDDDPDR
jgi:hypothetical protein